MKLNIVPFLLMVILLTVTAIVFIIETQVTEPTLLPVSDDTANLLVRDIDPSQASPYHHFVYDNNK